MANYRITDTTLTKLANAARRINESTDTLSPSEIATIIENTNVVDTVDTTATASQILSGSTAYVKGVKVTGNINTKSSSDLTVNGATITAPAGYYNSSASTSVTTTAHSKPTASINSSTGVVTASHTQTTGYVTGGTTTGTLNLTTQAAKTITPSKSSQTAVAAGRYTTGAVTVAAIPSQYVDVTDITKTADDIAVSGAIVTTPAGYYSSTIEKSVSTTTHNKPTLSLNSATGVVTASHTQNEGYVEGNTAINTLELTTKGAATITPSKSAQTIAKGQYLTGVQTIAAIPDEYVDTTNITKSSSDLTATGARVDVPAGYYPSDSFKLVTSATHSNPTIVVDSSTGTITASHVQGTGYVTGGTTTASTTLTAQAAKTVTPTKSSQTAVSAGRFTTGAITVAPIPNEYITTTDANATTSEIISGKTAYVNGSKVTGTLVTQNYYSGTSDPTSSLGNNGDLYLKVEV